MFINFKAIYDTKEQANAFELFLGEHTPTGIFWPTPEYKDATKVYEDIRFSGILDVEAQSVEHITNLLCHTWEPLGHNMSRTRIEIAIALKDALKTYPNHLEANKKEPHGSVQGKSPKRKS